jgi:hypothetical protein
MSPPDFEIEITEQGWLDPDLDDDPADLCSHGDIRLVIGGRVIAPGDVDGTVDFPGLAVEIAESEYRRQIVAFAEKAKEPFDAGSPKTPAGEIDEELYAEFWREYNGRLSRALAVIR